MSLHVDVRARRGDFLLDVQLQAAPGITAIVGPSGSGKSTLLDAIAGEVQLERGSIRLGAHCLDDVARGEHLTSRARRAVRVYQEGRLFPHLSAAANLHLGTRGAPALPFDEVVETLQLSALLDRRPERLSGGERQRVALGRALLTPADALLLDEPLHALDNVLRRRLLAALLAWNRRLGQPWLYVTHAVEEALLLADTAVALSAGRIQASGTPRQVLARGVDDPLAAADANDSLLRLRVVSLLPEAGVTQVSCGSLQLETSLLTLLRGEEFVAALAARDIILAAQRPSALSARNVLAARVCGLTPHGDVWDVELELTPDAPRLGTTVTAAAKAELDLELGRELWVLFKSSALRRLL